MSKQEKIEHVLVIALNLVIIALAETTGGGSFFFRTRYIEAIALLFTVLPLVRIFSDFRIYDPTILRVIQTSSVALLIFTESHATAYAGHFFFSLGDDTLNALVANFYIAALLVMVIGSEMVLSAFSRRSKTVLWASTAAFMLVAAFSIADALGFARPTFDATSSWPLTYTAAVTFVTVLGFVSFDRLRARLPLLRGFLAYFMIGATFITVSAVADFLAPALSAGFAWPAFQVAYVGAFAFYAAVSLMFLAFGKLRGFGGIYKDLQEEAAKE